MSQKGTKKEMFHVLEYLCNVMLIAYSAYPIIHTATPHKLNNYHAVWCVFPKMHFFRILELYIWNIYVTGLIYDTFFCIFCIFRTILLSVVSLLNEPNTYSPANVDASVMFRRWKESKGKDKEYENIIR